MPKNVLSALDKWALIARYFHYFNYVTGKLDDGCMDAIMAECDVSKTTIMTVMREYRSATAEGDFKPDLAPTMHLSGRKSTLTEENRLLIHATNNNSGGKLTIRALHRELGLNVCHQTIHNWCTDMEAESLTLYVKPTLTDEHKRARLHFVCSEVDQRNRRFHDQKDTIHVDESWFFLHRLKGLIRIFPGDPIPEPEKTKHKSHIPKIMFLTAVARPQPEHGFDGKIGIWRFSEDYVVQRRSRYHEAGDIIQRNVNVDAVTYRAMMLNEIIPAIKEKSPSFRGQKETKCRC